MYIHVLYKDRYSRITTKTLYDFLPHNEKWVPPFVDCLCCVSSLSVLQNQCDWSGSERATVWQQVMSQRWLWWVDRTLLPQCFLPAASLPRGHKGRWVGDVNTNSETLKNSCLCPVVSSTFWDRLVFVPLSPHVEGLMKCQFWKETKSELVMKTGLNMLMCLKIITVKFY